MGHLEDLPGDPRRPAVRRDRPDLALPGLPLPTDLAETWQVNLTDELERRDRIESGRSEPVAFTHNALHQVLERAPTAPASYTWDVHGNLKTRTGGLYGDAVFTHDWRDKLTSVQQGTTTTDILLDPLGRMVGKVRHTPDGDLARAYLHDGDQVALEYVQQTGGAAWQPERRHLWGRWIDDLAVEQVDTDGDGSLETTLYPITDLLGSVQLLTDDTGTILTPHFWSADGTRPSVTRVAWTGDGTLPTGDTVTAQAFEIGLSEPIDLASAANATATLTPDGGDPVTLTLTLAADSRTAYLTGATVTAGTQYTLHLDGLTDTSHNPLWPEDATITVADPNAYEVLDDTTAPQLLAVLDGADALYLLFDEPVEPAAGYDLTTAVSIVRSGQPVDGAATRLTPDLLQWQPAGGAGSLIPGGSYTLTAAHLTDLNGNPATASATFTHLNTTYHMLLLAYQVPTDTQPGAHSAYGLTTLFQGRTWHGDLGGYYYRARWYLPEMGEFAERDPVWPPKRPNRFEALNSRPTGLVDPLGTDAWTRDFNSFISREEREEARKWATAHSDLAAEMRGGIVLFADLFTQNEEQIEFLLSMAENNNGSAGASFEANIVAGIIGEHFGLNFQVFYNEGTYYASIFPFHTINENEDTPFPYDRFRFSDYFRRGFSAKELQRFVDDLADSGWDTIGIMASLGIGVNVAVADSSQHNNPRDWGGRFDTLSGAFTLQGIPGGISVFWSRFFKGLELSVGPGEGASFSRPYYFYDPALSVKTFDRELVKALHQILFTYVFRAS